MKRIVNMACKLYKLSSIFARVNSLVEKKLIKEIDAPVWFEVYKHFPPKYEPRYDRPTPDTKVQPIFYPEDKIRAVIHKEQSDRPELINFSEKQETKCQKFIKIYNDYLDKGATEEEAMNQLNNHLEKLHVTERKTHRLKTD